MNEARSMRQWMMIAAMASVGAVAWAQTPAPPVTSPATAEAEQVPATQAPTPSATAPVDPFPPVNLKNFTADSPTTAEVNAFLKAMWGYDDDRIWSVAAIQKTPAPGVARVVVFAADKAHPDKKSTNEFFITPDGKHAIAGGVIDFGPKPFDAASRAVAAGGEWAGRGRGQQGAAAGGVRRTC